MTQQTINGPANASSHMGPNTGDSPELGDSWAAVIAKINSMFADAYNNIEAVNNGVVAFAGGGQGSATSLKYGLNRITTVTTIGDSVKLPIATPGARCVVINSTANAMQVYGGNGAVDQINQTANATGVSQAGRSVCTYSCGVAGQWETNDVGDGYAGNFSTVSVQNAITAHAGGGQAAATPVTGQINRVTTVVTAADSVLLPPAVHGLQITVINAAANSLNLFPASQAQGGATGGDSTNGTQNGAFAVPGGKVAIAFCANDGLWHTVLSA